MAKHTAGYEFSPPVPPVAAAVNWTLSNIKPMQPRKLAGGITLDQAWGDEARAAQKKAHPICNGDMLCPSDEECEILCIFKNELQKRPELASGWDDELLVRFVRGLVFKRYKKEKRPEAVKKSLVRVIATAEWRTEHKVSTMHERVLRAAPIYEKYVKPFKDRYLGDDDAGRIIMLLESTGNAGVNELLAEFTMEELILHQTKDAEIAQIRKAQISKEKGYMIYKHNIICDIGKVEKKSMLKMMKLAKKYTYKGFPVNELCWPETLNSMWCLNSPWWLRGVWGVASKFYEQSLVSKVHIVRGIPTKKMAAHGIHRGVMPEGLKGVDPDLTKLKVKGGKKGIQRVEIDGKAGERITWLVEIGKKDIKFTVTHETSPEAKPTMIAEGVSSFDDPANGEASCPADGKVILTFSNKGHWSSRTVRYAFTCQRGLEEESNLDLGEGEVDSVAPAVADTA